MSDKTKRLSDDRRIRERFEAEEQARVRYPMPTCACGALARFGSYLFKGNTYYCLTHLPPDMREIIENSPLTEPWELEE